MQTAKPSADFVRRLFLFSGIVVFCFFILCLFALASFYRFLPECTFYKTWHLYCPGCGGTRAIHAFFHLDLNGILRNNVFLFPYVLLLIAFLITPRWRSNRCMIIFVSILPFFFAVLRNLPLYPFTLLAPH